MNLYEIEATRWYYSAVHYRVIADSYDDAYDRAGRNAVGVIEMKVSSPNWNGDEEYLDVEMLKTAHDMNVEDKAQHNHTDCQYLGNNMWDCGHIDLENPIMEDMQLPLISGHEALPDKPKSWIMWFEKWSDLLNGDAYAEAFEQYEASGGKL
jgi:hypothetical protein